MKKISVIVPIYNVEKYLNRCIDSIINQSYSNLEIILVDDGSPDNCPSICDEYAKKDNRIIVIHKENGGLSSARNAGLDIATGDYIGFVDSDDFIHKDFYKILIEEFDNECSIVFCSLKKLYNNKVLLEEEKNPNYQGIIYTENNYNDLVNEKFNNYERKTFGLNEIWFYSYINEDFILNDSYVWNKLYKKDIFNTLRFEEGMFFEDKLINPFILLKVTKMNFVNLPLYFYERTNLNSIVNNVKKEIFKYIDDVKVKYNVIVNLEKANIDIELKENIYKTYSFLQLFRCSKLINEKHIEKEKKEEILKIINDVYLINKNIDYSNSIITYLLDLFIQKKYKLLKIICVILRSFHYGKNSKNFCIGKK